VAQNLQNIYTNKANKNYVDTIKGALDREIIRQEEKEELKLNDSGVRPNSSRMINFNPSANTSEDRY